MVTSEKGIGRCGRNVGHGHNDSHFCLSCVHLVCFLSKSTEFHEIRMECQIIIVHFLLLISPKYPACAKIDALFPISPRLLSLCYRGGGLYKEELMIYIKRRGVT